MEIVENLDIVVGGVQKAGTTSLYRYFLDHAGLRAPNRKELHFFDNESVDWGCPDYTKLYAMLGPPDGERRSFDITPIYLFWPPALARIRAYNSHCKLIFIFRDPIERAWSHWRMEARRQADDMPFGAAIREGRGRLANAAPLGMAWRVFSYVERGFYADQLRRLFGLFPREQILLLRSADLQHDHQAVLGRIASFLGISDFPALLPHTVFQAPEDGAVLGKGDVDHLRELFYDDVLAFSELSGLAVDDWLTVAHK
ncbi:MAG: sulfotransferase domain-containing protein [Parvibaculum sp.]|nr:sulfotransferase domain-containing protein [Parvibaculum sp.]